MDAGKVLYSRLAGQTSADSRVYPLTLPQDATFPAVTFQQISSVPHHAFGQDTGLKRVRMQVNSWAKSYAGVRTLAGEVEGRLSRFRWELAGVRLIDILLENEIDGYEESSETKRVIQDYTLYLADV